MKMSGSRPMRRSGARSTCSASRQIAATGIDGIYVDIPYWMTHFTGWEKSWASFDDYTVKAFHDQTGLNAKTDIKLGDFNDPGFRKWVDFRIQTITDFMAEVRKNAISVNPNIAVIPEIYPGIEESAVRVGADVYQLYPVVDAVAHEYEFGEGEDHTAASRSQLDWFLYQVGMQSFRAFAGNKPTWMLNYSWDGNPRVTPSDAMKNLAMSELIAGANFWDAPGHSMAGSNDMTTRIQIFHWIAANQSTFSSPRTPVGKVGVYFSDTTRNYYPDEFIVPIRAFSCCCYAAISISNCHATNSRFLSWRNLILPDVRVLSSKEVDELHNLAASCKIISTGNIDPQPASFKEIVQIQGDPGSNISPWRKRISTGASADTQSQFLDSLEKDSEFSISASTDLVAYIATVQNQTHWFFANFKGLKQGAATLPVPEKNVVLEAPLRGGTTLHFLPFLGTEVGLKGAVSGIG